MMDKKKLLHIDGAASYSELNRSRTIILHHNLLFATIL